MAWGPWIEHDGKGCPADVRPGVYIEVQYRSGRLHKGRASGEAIYAPNWIWPKPDGRTLSTDCMRYRVRKPRALEQLRRIAANPPRKTIRHEEQV